MPQAPTPALVPVILCEKEWRSLPAKLADPFFADLAEKNLLALRAYESTRGASLVDVPARLTEPAGERIQWPWRALKGRILRSALACRLGHAEVALPIARETIAHLLRPDTWAAEFANAGARRFDLKVADLVTIALTALEGLAPWLTAEERDGLVARIADQGLAAYLRGVEEGEWWHRCNFNWSAATHGAAGLGALALAHTHPELSSRILTEVDAGLRPLLQALPEGGWWFEGAMYHTTTLGHLTDFVVGSLLARGDDLGLSQNPRFVEALVHRPACLAPDGNLFNFSNCPESPAEWYLPQAYFWAERLHRPELAAFEDTRVKPWHDTLGVFYDVEAFLHRPANPSRVAPPAAPALHHFRGLDWATWRGPSVWAAFRSGFIGANHNNSDLGHFVLGRGFTRYLVDPGYGHVATAMHNAVTVRNQTQADCATARIVTLARLGEHGLHLACDLREAYPHALLAHVRHLVLTESGGVLVDCLRLRSGLPTRVWCTAHFQTYQDVTLDGATARLSGPEGGLSLVPLTPMKTPAITTQEISRQNERHTLRHLAYSPAQDTEELLLAWRLDFGGVATPLVVTRFDAAGLAFTTDGQAHQIAFASA